MKISKKPPLPSIRMWRFTGRNFLVWKKLFIPSITAHLIDPVIFLVGFGLGIGALIGNINGEDYLQYIAAGMICYGTMNSTSFEALYSTFSRMHVQRTWESVLNAPMTLDDILLGEWLWATIKGIMAGCAILIVLTILGLTSIPFLPLSICALALTALSFAGIGLAVNAIAHNYEFFSYYFTLFITPMMMLSGAFFPTNILPNYLQWVSAVLPLTHAVNLARSTLSGNIPDTIASDVAILLLYAIIGLYIATLLTRKRLIK